MKFDANMAPSTNTRVLVLRNSHDQTSGLAKKDSGGHAQVYGLAFADTAITQWKHAILRHSQPRRRVTTRQLSPSPQHPPHTPLVTSVYSTLCSALFFIVALVQPKYGRIVSKDGRFSPSSAALLTQFIAKTIELSFVMVFLVFIGQVLSRRASQQKGINLASIAMRSWIL
ncbi:predicted protein [Plenodomus lingam JN3]|uniref:Predicted protein n=1 Tax=Leptosphaeria maculans (strain JN3 / isolate v23.1.3 / race Av1-4-5-6-7-8) TaxID=985895 RepID=E5A4K8_LEPMJ|nr:predicted protein [Plenodomus lingam JN3]CBX98556.1 predicted protein [Plenodomus lingam JN3]